MPDGGTLAAASGVAPSPLRVASSLEPHREVVPSLLELGVEMAAMYERLRDDFGYTGSYSSARRFVHRLRPKDPHVVLGVECAPREEAQVDCVLCSLGELDSRLRSGALDLSNTVPVWQSELFGFLEKSWGSRLRRFDTVVIAGGGVMILREALLARFRGKAHIPRDPIISAATGMYKYMLMRERRDR